MRLLLICWLCLFSVCYGQDSIVPCERAGFPGTGGLVAYYFWEEDSNGFVIPGTFQKPYIQNVMVEEDKQYRLPYDIPTSAEMIKLVEFIAHYDHGNTLKSLSIANGEKFNKNFPLVVYVAQNYRSMVYIKRGESWNIHQEKTVLLFDYCLNGGMRFRGSTDSIALARQNKTLTSNGQYTLCSWLDSLEQVSHQSVITYNGQDVTEQCAGMCEVTPKRVLVFVNGYRGPLKDKDKSDNLVSTKDRYGYWYKLDNRFIERLSPDGTFYLDANFPVKTSVHNSRLRFTRTLVRWSLFCGKRATARQVRRMTEHPKNIDGFYYRKEKGRLAGLAFLYSRCSSPNCDTVKDTIDIVCHSMGYAYTLGFLEAIQDHVVMGSCYIIAPENANVDGYDWTKFQSVWQYGSNLDQPNADRLNLQDGVAPQIGVKGIDQLPPNRGGRLFFPADWPNKQFIHSHMVYSYDWIFDRILPGQPGYVTTKH